MSLAILALARAACAETTAEAPQPEVAVPPESQVRSAQRLRRIGSAIFSIGYGLDAGVGGLVVLDQFLGDALQHGAPNHEDLCVGDVCHTSFWKRSAHYTPLFIPIAGPFWSLGYSDVRRSAVRSAVLGTGLALQLAGASIYMQGLMMTPEVPEPTFEPSVDRDPFWTLTPMWGVAFRGVEIAGSF